MDEEMSLYARLAQGAYGSNDVDGWNRDDEFSDNQRTVYWRDKPDGGKEAVLSFRGTELKGTKKNVWRDMTDNVALGLGLEYLNSRFRRAKRLADAVSNKYGSENLTLVGHSLGGSQAIYASDNTGIPAYTYNAGISPIEALLNPSIAISKYVSKLFRGGKKKVKSYVTLLDPISNFSLLMPDVNTFVVPQKAKSPHALSNFITGTKEL